MEAKKRLWVSGLRLLKVSYPQLYSLYITGKVDSTIYTHKPEALKQ
jgi:hypothetical protein